LEIAMPMLLSFNVAGLPFIGSDTGGFFGNPNEELLTRWFQASAYHPFFRAHAHHDAKRREPYVFGEPHTSRLRSSVVTRYQHLPLW
jgi:alpha 1,3-glucosidase